MSGAALILMILMIVACVAIILVIMVQNPKGGGLSSTFGGSGGGQMFGVQRTNDFLTKATWTLALIIAGLALTANFIMRDKEDLNSIKTTTPVQQEQPAETPVSE